MTRAEKVLFRLRENAPWPVSAVELCQPNCGGIDFRRRISDLRKLGHVITATVIPGKPYKAYKYEGQRPCEPSPLS